MLSPVIVRPVASYEDAAAAVFRDLAVRDNIVPGWFRPA